MEQTPQEKQPIVATQRTPEKEPENESKYDSLPFLVSFNLESRSSKILLATALTVVFFVTLFSFFLMPPIKFPKDKLITIKEGASLGQASFLLKEENLIRSRKLFEICAMIVGGDKRIIAGQYLFKDPTHACTIAFRITRGISGVPSVRVTIPEGMSNKEIVAVLMKRLPNFDETLFVESARSKEGYLFPDTYFFSAVANAQDVVTAMSANFEKKIAPLASAVGSSGHSLRDIVVMASILEKETKTEEDMELVSGILWKRIKLGMPLQVDATFLYLLGKKSSEVTQADLKMKSAYNTYRNKGLPGGPIGNPGIAAIRAAIRPKDSPYLYYLSDDKGAMHYAKTFVEHVANKRKYLK